MRAVGFDETTKGWAQAQRAKGESKEPRAKGNLLALALCP
jgi:hypothetical protein